MWLILHMYKGMWLTCYIGTVEMWLIFHTVLYVVYGICIAGKCSILHKVNVMLGCG
jgi:hypothetical protein